MSGWQGDGTDLDRGFSTIRMVTNQWECSAKEGPPLAGSAATLAMPWAYTLCSSCAAPCGWRRPATAATRSLPGHTRR